MKNASSMKTSKFDSPKTPGGISKSLLTPCRRVGLSRNWRKGSISPFISPIPGTAEPKENIQAKRKIEDVDLEKSINDIVSSDVNTTPVRNVDIPRRKKSKILTVHSEPLSPINEVQDTTIENTAIENVSTVNSAAVTTILKTKSRSIKNIPLSRKEIPADNIQIQSSPSTSQIEEIPEVAPVIKSKSKNKKFTSPSKGKGEPKSCVKFDSDSVPELKKKKNSTKIEKSKTISPENLTKECIVVIQKKLFKGQVATNKNENEILEQKPTSHTLFDSDSDDVPLCKLNNKENVVIDIERQESPTKDKVPIQPRVLALDEDDDFMEKSRVKVKKLEDKTTSTTSLKKAEKKKPKPNKKPISITVKNPEQSSQSSEDDDFDFIQKKTILIKKSYDKVTTPMKAKSTGSITQKDIDELRSRIEVKKKLLLAKAMSSDTEELRGLIKRWQKGCQDALSELLEMMRSKFPDKQNMEISEMLQTLKIPTHLVGYDEENECFNTPDDTSIVLGKFNDI